MVFNVERDNVCTICQMNAICFDIIFSNNGGTLAACVCLYVYECAMLERWVYVLCSVLCLSFFLPVYSSAKLISSTIGVQLCAILNDLFRH